MIKSILFMLRAWLLKKVDHAPMFLVMLQTPFYIWLILDQNQYAYWKPFFDLMLQDSILFYILLLAFIRNWNAVNKTCICGLVLVWLSNVVFTLLGVSNINYFYVVLSVGYIAYGIAFFKYGADLMFNHKNRK